MFDFEKLEVYKKAKDFHYQVCFYLKSKQLDRVIKDQFYRASFSIILNLAEGSGRFSKADRRNFYVISRSSVFECVAILDVLKDKELIKYDIHKKMYFLAEELSKILFVMIKNLNK